LVTRDTLMKNDPEFVSTWHTDTLYFWIVAEAGDFTLDVPMPAGGTPPELHNSLSYVQANVVASDPESVAHPCRGIAVRGDRATLWPAWFDRMPAIQDVKIR